MLLRSPLRGFNRAGRGRGVLRQAQDKETRRVLVIDKKDILSIKAPSFAEA